VPRIDRASGAAPRSWGDLAELLTCADCRDGNLIVSTEESIDPLFICTLCDATYPIREGIPVMLPAELRPGRDVVHESRGHKQQQAEFSDSEADDAWEINRPHGAPAFHGWLLGEKFRRSIEGLRPILPGSLALTVCGGSGLDAEFLALAGAHVISSDISLGAARRARERARRYGLQITPIVADAENLPFADRAIDIAYVHDGLHHLEEPAAGLAEMARVARRAVSVTEPAKAALTALAVRLNLALEQEEAGNRVARLTLDEIVETLERRDFRVLNAHRYGMYYKHNPGWAIDLLSRERIFPLATTALSLLNTLAGRVGNKLTVQAVRAAAGPEG
jgi:SAM-dependent methyltransferase